MQDGRTTDCHSCLKPCNRYTPLLNLPLLDRKPVYQLFSFVATAILCLQSCTSGGGDIFIVSQYQNPAQAPKEGRFYYSSFNLILDSSDRLFFHSKDSLMNCCDTGADYNYPDYIDLRPDDLLPYSDSSFLRLVDSAKKLPKQEKHSIQIAALKDTVNSERFFRLMSVLKQKDFTNYVVRLATEEEREVLKAKIENRPYDFYKVKWTSRFSHTLFPPPMPDSAK